MNWSPSMQSFVMARVKELSVEHHRETLGIGESSPRISWKIDTTAQGWTQKSYELEIHSTVGKPHTYTVKSDQSVLVPWPASPLKSAEIAIIKVRVTGLDGKTTDWSSPLTVETGLLSASDWNCSVVQSPPTADTKVSMRPTFFRRDFKTTKAIAKARLYITSHGIYEAELNGIPIGDHVFAPGWTSYKHELPYQTFDVTNHLIEGDNALGVYVGEGWYCGRLTWSGARHFWGDKLGVISQLLIDYTDGTTQKVESDKEWKYSEEGPVTRGEIYDGEDFDSRLLDKNWSKIGASKGQWKDVLVEKLDAGILRAPDGPPIRRTEDVKPVQVLKSPSGKTIIDFGQNLVGWLKVKVTGSVGHEITFVHTEVLEHGEAATRPLRSAKCTDRLILSGESVVWEPRFTFHGFRYAEVNNWPHAELDVADVVAVVVHTDMKRTGHFECSNDLLNKLHSNVTWSMKGNFFGVPTDCPQRDERLGWTGDIQAFAPTAAYLYDCSGMLKSWLRNLAAETMDLNGVAPVVSPNVLPGMMGAQAVWSDALLFVPWDLYGTFGDLELLHTQLESMLAWLERGVIRDEKTKLWKADGFQLGDWLDPAAPPDDPAAGVTDAYLVADAFLVASTDLAVKVATALAKTDIVESYTKQSKDLHTQFRNKYIAPAGRIVSDSQTGFALAIVFDLFSSPEQLSVAADRLVELVLKKNKFRIATGFAGTPVIGHALTKVNQSQVFYRMLYERGNPSWLYPVTMGATTIWERWDSMLPDGSINPGEMTSFNHYALGAVADWMHTTIGGLRPTSPGYKTFSIAPIPGGDLKHTTVTFESPYGTIKSSWEILQGNFLLRFTVPPGTTAEVKLPGGGAVVKSYGSGEYEVREKYESPIWPVKALHHEYAQPPDDSYLYS